MLGDTRRDAGVSLGWVGLIASCVSARSDAGGSAALASWQMREVFGRTAHIRKSSVRCHVLPVSMLAIQSARLGSIPVADSSGVTSVLRRLRYCVVAFA